MHNKVNKKVVATTTFLNERRIKMSENMIMFCYCADQRDTFTSENKEEQTATRMMFDILARAYAREVLKAAFDEAAERKGA